jgi:hypothetical protein
MKLIMDAAAAEDDDDFDNTSNKNQTDAKIMILFFFFNFFLCQVWELSQGEPRPDLTLPYGSVHPSNDGQYLAILRDHRHVGIYKTDSGEQHGQLDYGYGEVRTANRPQQRMPLKDHRMTLCRRRRISANGNGLALSRRSPAYLFFKFLDNTLETCIHRNSVQMG